MTEERIKEIETILRMPVACTDGSAHYLDENQRNYLLGVIIQALAPPPDSSRLLTDDELSSHWRSWVDKDYTLTGRTYVTIHDALKGIRDAQDAKTASLVRC